MAFIACNKVSIIIYLILFLYTSIFIKIFDLLYKYKIHQNISNLNQPFRQYNFGLS